MHTNTIKMKDVILTIIILLALCEVQVSGKRILTYGDKCWDFKRKCDLEKGLLCLGKTCSCPLLSSWDGGSFGLAGLLGGGRCVSVFKGLEQEHQLEHQLEHQRSDVGMIYATPLAVAVTFCANLMLQVLFLNV